MPRKPVAVLLVAIILMALAAGPLRPTLSRVAHAIGLRRTPVAVAGAPLPPIELTELNGSPARIAHSGTVVYNVFTSWCPSCNQELPDLLAAQASLQRQGVRFVGIDQGEPAQKVSAFVSERAIPYPVLLDNSRASTTILGARVIPETLIVRDGIVKQIIVGPTTAQQLTRAVQSV